MGSKRKRSELSLSQKMEIIQLSEDKVSQTEISRRFECSRYTVSKILKQKDELQSALENQNGSRKRRRVSETSDFDSAMRFLHGIVGSERGGRVLLPLTSQRVINNIFSV